ncbi:hypothetical protein PG985_013535 [Apiospora marii]|uniref:uncharacterized protein n=1 Tax=Apiospora marii TaxID=335849 RepID=UPI00312D5D37
MGIFFLPNELLHQIVREFCRHCQEGTEPSKFLVDELDDDDDADMSGRDDGVVDNPQATGEGEEWKTRNKDELRAILEARQTLLNLCRTCSVFRGIAQPYLYHRIEIRKSSTTKMSLLLRTLVLRPNLAASVKHLTIGPCFPDERDELVEERRISQNVLETGLIVAMPGVRPDWPPIDTSRCTSYAAVAQIVVAQTHSLETFVLSGTLDSPWEFLAHVDPGKCSMPRLRQLELSCDRDPFDLADYTYAFQLAPNLARLRIINCNAVSRQLSLDRVQALCITDTEIPLPDMETLLASCRGGLRAFSGWFMSPKGAKASQVVELLRRHGHGRTLADLALVAEAGSREVWGDELDAIGTPLDRFPSLRRLVLDNRYAGEGEYPHLKEVVMVCVEPYSEWNDDRRDRLRDRLAEVGVTLTEGKVKRPGWVEEL